MRLPHNEHHRKSRGRAEERHLAGTDLHGVTRKLRCAIYTRKSSEEGLDMEFNSLDAQREACQAYIASQRGEGWLQVDDRYDDGGVSGGTLDRPALKRLLADVQAGRIDIVVVYKVDRLSRSLLDFHKLIELFERHQTTFVSITQSFNTTDAMGRMHLNIMLTFAQYEREVIGERIRDKVAASRKKGMWMGGWTPLGYEVRDRKLLIHKEDAERVRSIFKRFVQLKSATRLARELVLAGAKNRYGHLLDKSVLYKLLNNRVYIGDAVHKGVAYPGEHEAIVDRRLWDQAHAILKQSPRKRGANPRDRVAGFRLLNLLPGVGPATAKRMLEAMAESADPVGALRDLPAPPRSGGDWASFVETVGNIRDAGWPAELELARVWYQPHLDRIHEDAEVRRADLIQLEGIASGYPSRERFLTELTLDPPGATSDQAGVPLLDEDYLILSTIHSAKGQEWKSVFVLNVVDGCIPSDLGAGTTEELEEERRLLYVAMTRAKDDLHLIIPQRFFVHGQSAQSDRHLYASRTRFIPEALRPLFERTSWPVAAEAARSGARQGPRIDIAKHMRERWR